MQLSDQTPLAPFPNGVIAYTPVQVRPIIVVEVITIHIHQQLMGLFQDKYLEVCALLLEGIMVWVCGVRHTSSTISQRLMGWTCAVCRASSTIMGWTRAVRRVSSTTPRSLFLILCSRHPLAFRDAAL